MVRVLGSIAARSKSGERLAVPVATASKCRGLPARACGVHDDQLEAGALGLNFSCKPRMLSAIRARSTLRPEERARLLMARLCLAAAARAVDEYGAIKLNTLEL